MPANAAFSSVAWKIMAIYLLGIPHKEFQDFNEVWSIIRDCEAPFGKKFIANNYQYSLLRAHLLGQIRNRIAEYEQNPDENRNDPFPENIIQYWIQNNVVKTIITELPDSARDHAYHMARKHMLTLEEMFYLDSIFGLMIEMVEKTAAVMTQIAYRLSVDYALLLRCRTYKEDCFKVVYEILRHRPPVPIVRRLRWDIDVIDPATNNTYQANKDDLFVAIPP